MDIGGVMPDEPSAGHEPGGDSTPPENGAAAGGAPMGGAAAGGAAAGGAAAGRGPGNGAAAGDGGGTPEFLEAGFFPRGAGVPAPGQARRSGAGSGFAGSGFAAGGVLDASLPGPALAGSADAVTWTADGYAGIDDDELIGVLAAWQKTEAWAAAGRLSAVAELIRRRPVPRSGAPRGPGGPEDVLASDALSGPGRPGAPRGPERPASPGRPQTPRPDSNPSPDSPRPGGGAGAGAGPVRIPVEWGKFCADELAVALASSRRAAERMLALAHDLADRLPLTARALREGVIDVCKTQIIAEATRVLDDAAAAAAEALGVRG